MPILERKIAHKMTTMCSHMTYQEFVLPLHKHAEYQLIIFTHGSGKQFVGGGVAPYAKGDVALIGSYVPHLHLCKSRMKSGENAGKEEPGNIGKRELKPGLETELEDRLYSSGEAIQFSPQLFPSSLLNLPDYAHISELLSKSQYGIRFYDEGLYDELLKMMKAFDSSPTPHGLSSCSRFSTVCIIARKRNSCRLRLTAMLIVNPSWRSLSAESTPIYIITSVRRWC